MGHDAIDFCRYVWKGLERLPRTIAKIKSEDFQVRGTASVGRAGERREKSLGLLSQRFVQIFVQSPDDHTVPLDAAAETLLGEAELQWPGKLHETIDAQHLQHTLRLLTVWRTVCPEERGNAAWIGRSSILVLWRRGCGAGLLSACQIPL